MKEVALSAEMMTAKFQTSLSTPAYWHTAYKGVPDPDGETHQAYMTYNKTELLWALLWAQISFTTYSSLVVRLWCNAGVTREERCRRGAWRRSPHLLAKLISDVLQTLERKTVAFTQNN